MHDERMSLTRKMLIGAGLACYLPGCSASPCGSELAKLPIDDPYEAIAEADTCAAQGDEAGALERYQWGVAHGTGVQPGFLRLAENYGPAKEALEKYWHRLRAEIVRVNATDDPPEGLLAFVNLSFHLGNQDELMIVYEGVRDRMPPSAKVRQELWTAIEGQLVERRRYLEATLEHDLVLDLMRYQLSAFKSVGPDDEKKHSILLITGEYAVEQYASHFEALVGSHKEEPAKEFAEELLQLRPRPSTFAHLLRSARRAGSPQMGDWVRTRARELLSSPDYEVFQKLSSGSAARTNAEGR